MKYDVDSQLHLILNRPSVTHIKHDLIIAFNHFSKLKIYKYLLLVLRLTMLTVAGHSEYFFFYFFLLITIYL